MSRWKLVINGTDFSAVINKWGVGYQPVKVHGPNEAVAMSGSTIVDLLKVKDKLILTGNAVPQATYSALDAMCRLDYVTAVYDHPATGQEVTKVMIPELSQGTRVPLRAGEIWIDGWTLTLEER